MDIKDKIIKYSLMCCKYDKVNESVARHNRAMTSLYELREIIKNENIDTAFYLELLKHEDDRVRLTACGHCLHYGIYIRKTKRTLKKLGKTAATPLLRFSAEALLEKYKEEGYLK